MNELNKEVSIAIVDGEPKIFNGNKTHSLDEWVEVVTVCVSDEVFNLLMLGGQTAANEQARKIFDNNKKDEIWKNRNLWDDTIKK